MDCEVLSTVAHTLDRGCGRRAFVGEVLALGSQRLRVGG